MRKLLVMVCVAVLLGAVIPSVVFAQAYLDPQVTLSPSTPLSVGSSVTLNIVMQNSSSTSTAIGSAKIYIPNVFSVGSQTGCVHISGPTTSGSNLVYNWNPVPDNGVALPATASTPPCKFPLTLNTLPSGTIKASVDATTSSGTRTGSATFNINIPAPTFSQDLAASVNGQNVTLTFKASNASSCAGTSSPAVGGWNGATLCSSASGCASVSQTLSSLTPGKYSFTAKCTSAGGSKSSTAAATVGGATTDVSASLQLAPNTAAPPYTAGTTIALAFTVANVASAGTATGVKATFQVLNSALLSNITSDKCGTASDGRIAWSIGNLAANQAVTCTVTGKVASAAAPINLSATAVANETDANPVNNTAPLVLQTYQAPVTKSKTVDAKPTTKDSTHVALNRNGSMALFQSKETRLVANNQQVSGGQDIYSVNGNGQAVLETKTASGQLLGTSSLPAIAGDGSVVAFSHSASVTNAATLAAGQSNEVVTGQIFAGVPGQPKHQVDAGANQPASGGPSVTSSGGSRKLVFCSGASNLVQGDSNGQRDIFLADPLNPGQPLQRISTDDNNQQLAGDSCEPAISADGSKVVFTLSSSSRYGTAARQVVRKDLITHKLEVISRSPSGAYANNDNSEPSIDADGSVIAFTSAATNLDGLAAPVGGKEVFVSVAQSGVDGAARYVQRARNGAGNIPNGGSQHPHLSDDGTILAMQTTATNFFADAAAAIRGMDALTASSSPPPSCGSVVVTTNYFVPGQVGQCSESSTNQNPVISGDGTSTGYDSNQPQTNSSGSTNYNTYEQGLADKNLNGSSNFNGDLSGQWYDPNQNGQGLVLDVARPNENGVRYLLLTWFVYTNGHPTWVTGVGQLHAGSGAQAGSVVVDMQAGIAKSTAFPIGNAPAVPVLWGTISLVFADAGTATMSWSTTFPGFNSGSMALTHLLPVSLPSADVAGSGVKACYSGPWFSTNPQQTGQGFEIEVVPTTPPLLAIDWFTFSPTDGSPLWLAGAGPISGNSAQVELQLIDGAGAQFPPRFDPDPTQSIHHDWGGATFTFADGGHASVSWNPKISGFGAGSMQLKPVIFPGFLDRRPCD